MLDRSCRFPNTDPHQLWILLAGRKVTLSEWKSWTRTLYGGRKWFFLIAFATLLLFAMDMVQSLTFGYKWYETADVEAFFDSVSNEYGAGYEGVVQYPFGYGLSYTSFSITEAAFTESDCPGRDCVHSGSIGSTGRSIVCLPNRVEIRVISAEADVDFVVG